MSPFWKRPQNSAKKFGSLYEAVEAGDFDAARDFLKKGSNPNLQSGNGRTPLLIAAARGYLEIAKLLIEAGSEVDFLIENGGTPLMAACSGLHPSVVSLLLSKGAQPNKKGQGGWFPLICIGQPTPAVFTDQLRCIQLLIESGALPNERTEGGSTPLMRVAWFGNYQAAEELLRHGANATLKDNRGRTAAMLAFERGHDSLAQFLSKL